MTRGRRILVATVLALGAVALAARALLLPWLHGFLERSATQALGREVAIAGPLGVSFSPWLQVTAAGVTVANVARGSETVMLRAERVAVTLDATSLLSGAPRIRDVALDGVRALVETDADGRSNWSFAPAKPPAPPTPATDRFPLDVAHAVLRRVEVIYRPSGDGAAVPLAATELDARLDPAARSLEIRGAGHVAAKPWNLAGRLDSIDTLWAGGESVAALEGSVGTARIALHARTRGPLRLAAPEVEGSVSGTDAAEALALIGLGGPLAGEFRLQGRLTPAADGAALDLDARAEGIEAHVRGSLKESSAPGRPVLSGFDVAIDAAGPDAARVGAWLGVQGLPKQSFALDGRLRREGSRWNFDDAALRLGSTVVTFSGELAGASRIEVTRLVLHAAGPNLADFSELARTPLPRAPFTAGGRVSRRGDGTWSFADTTLRAGRNSVAISGELGAPPAFAGTTLALEAHGGDPAEVAALRPLHLPAGAFALAGRLARLEDGRWSLQETRVRAGGTELEVSGSLGVLPRLVGTDLLVAAKGRDLAELSPLTRLTLPPGSFELGGRLTRREEGLAIEGATLRFRAATLTASGAIGEPPGCPRLDLTFTGGGADLARFSDVARTTLPRGPFSVSGRVARQGRNLVLHGVKARAGEESAEADGLVTLRPYLAGSDLTLRAAGPDLARFGQRFGIADLPARPFDLAGRLRRADDGDTLDGFVATVGTLRATLDGRLGAPSLRSGTVVTVQAAGSELRELASWNLPPELAASLTDDPFTLRGKVRIDGGVVHVEGGQLDLGSDSASFDGTLGALPALDLLDLSVHAAGTSAARLERFLTASAPAVAGRLPPVPYSVSGQLRHAASGVELRGVEARVDRATLRLDGIVGVERGFRGTDLRFDLSAPDATLLARVARAPAPPGKLAARGRIESGDATLFERVALAIGEARAELDGRLGPAPDFAGSDLRFEASGPDLAVMARLVSDALAARPSTAAPAARPLADAPAARPPSDDLALPHEPFAISAEVTGEARRFASRRLSVRLGESDVTGTLALRLDARPLLEVDLRAQRLALRALPAEFASSGDIASAHRAAAGGEHRIPDLPLPFAALHRLDADVRFQAAELSTPALAWRDVVLTGTLRNGSLLLDRLEGTGLHGGHAAFRVAIDPLGDGYRVETSGRIDGARLLMTRTATPSPALPTLDLELALAGEGRTLRDLAARASGRVLVVLGPGAIPPELSRRLRAGVLRELIETFNPFRKDAPQNALECGILVADLAGGAARLDPVAVRTDALTVTGEGRLDLASEAIDLSWIVKPRKGLGMSASVLAASYVKLGGTLAAPKLDMKPLSAAVSTGAAVATAGITLVSRQLYNRLTAERSVCADALAEYRRKSAPKPRPPAGGSPR